MLPKSFLNTPSTGHQTINYHIGVNIEELFSLLIEQIQAGLCFGVEITGSFLLNPNKSAHLNAPFLPLISDRIQSCIPETFIQFGETLFDYCMRMASPHLKQGFLTLDNHIMKLTEGR